MSRWVLLTINEPIQDLSKDLADGLNLCKLVNCIMLETGQYQYTLKPVYVKPTFKLQRVENVDDVLKFCSLVLKINFTSVSADNVVDGNLKLILGLIWTLFVYATSNLISLKNETRSFGEIKAILLKWISGLGHRRALPEISNFDKDWSLQRNARPDLVLASILDFYIPNFVSYSEFLKGKKLANLEHVIQLVYTDLEIPKLAEADDFNVLVPDEKCIIFYVLQWYMFFEVLDCAEEPAVEELANVSMTDFLEEVVGAVKVRNKYETRALRLVNQINNNISRLALFLAHIDNHVSVRDNLHYFKGFCCELTQSDSVALQIESRECWPHLQSYITKFLDLLHKYMHFRLVLKPEYAYRDIPELQLLHKSVNCKLKDVGLSAGYWSLKLLSLESIGARLQRLLEADSLLALKISEELDQLMTSGLSSLPQLISSLEQKLISDKDNSSVVEIREFLDKLDIVSKFQAELRQTREELRTTHTTQDIRVILETLEVMQVLVTPVTPEDSKFAKFKDLVSSQKNRTNLTYTDAKYFMKVLIGDQEIVTTTYNDFLALIPTRRLLNRSESDDFSMYHSDDSEDLAPIFDQVQKTLEHKLLGNFNKLYDLDGLVAKMEGGFKV